MPVHYATGMQVTFVHPHSVVTHESQPDSDLREAMLNLGPELPLHPCSLVGSQLQPDSDLREAILNLAPELRARPCSFVVSQLQPDSDLREAILNLGPELPLHPCSLVGSQLQPDSDLREAILFVCRASVEGPAGVRVLDSRKLTPKKIFCLDTCKIVRDRLSIHVSGRLAHLPTEIHTSNTNSNKDTHVKYRNRRRATIRVSLPLRPLFDHQGRCEGVTDEQVARFLTDLVFGEPRLAAHTGAL
jgi:hypothetical protein